MFLDLRRRCAAALAALLSATLLACGGGADPDAEGTAAPSIAEQPADVQLSPGQSATFSVAVDGDEPLRYRWRRDGVEIDGAAGPQLRSGPLSEDDNGAHYEVEVSNEAGSVTSDVATLSVGDAGVAPQILEQPEEEIGVVAGDVLQFDVRATGSQPLRYQWRRDGQDIAGATGPSLAVRASADAPGNGASYSVLIANDAGEVESLASALAVQVAPVAPAIATQPRDTTVTEGQTASFAVRATGTRPFSYRWRKNGKNIAGATGSRYTTPATKPGDDGALYSVLVTNAAGKVLSRSAELGVKALPVAPKITRHPASAIVYTGKTTTFKVTARGTTPLSFQWFKDGKLVQGATKSSYTPPRAKMADNGARYSVTVSNRVGHAVSRSAKLTVTTKTAAARYPDKQIRLIVPFAAGGPTDAAARDFAIALGRSLGDADIVIENHAGAGGTLGASEAAEAPPDGYTLLFHHIGMATAPAFYRSLAFDPLDDFDPLGLTTEQPLVLAGRPGLPPTTFTGLRRWLQDRPGTATQANGGLGSPSHLCALLLQQEAEVDPLNVPYKGVAPALTDLIGNQVDTLCDQTSTLLPSITAGNIRAYAVTTAQRNPHRSLAKLPTLDEAGLDDFRLTVWHGLYAPRGTPPAILDKINAAVLVALQDARFERRQAALNASIVTDSRTSRARHRKFLAAEIKRWGPLIKASGQYAD